jgi:ureidoglycolate hydrolase
MDEKMLEIREYTGDGYAPLVDFGAWRVAVLNFAEGQQPGRIEFIERHNRTDEVFVLLKGNAILFLAEGRQPPGPLSAQRMEPGKAYNIKQGTWHTVAMSPDGAILLVENVDTTRENSNYAPLTAGQRRSIVATARQEKLQEA